jgi:hypothetical protein
MPEPLDGNMLAGPLGDVFAVDVSTAVGLCAGCGMLAPLAADRVYADAPGLVLRCVSCDGVLLRLVRADHRAWLDLRGIRSLQLTLPADDR